MRDQPLKRKKQIQREHTRIRVTLLRAKADPVGYRKELISILNSIDATDHHREQAQALLNQIKNQAKDKLDAALAKYDSKPQVSVDSTPAPTQEEIRNVYVDPASGRPEPTPEERAQRFRLALEERAKQEREEFQRVQSDYQREWDRGWEPW